VLAGLQQAIVAAQAESRRAAGLSKLRRGLRNCPEDWGCGHREIFHARFVSLGGRREAWIVQLVKTGADSEKQSLTS
jgi:hypothetical protein